MKALLNKELKLSLHVTVFIFFAFASMLLIPAYPYYIPFFYTTLSLFFTFQNCRENNDILFTALLPIRKRDCVRARIYTVAVTELIMIIISIPFAFLSNQINPVGNSAGIDANIALYGMVLIMYSVFNIIFIPGFYRTGYNIGKPFLIACIFMMIYILGAEASLIVFPVIKKILDGSSSESFITKLSILAAGITVYFSFLVLSYKRAASAFEKVDL